MKWLWRSALALILLMSLVLGVITWLGSREDSLRWLLQRAVQNTSLKLELEGLRGSLWHGIQVARVRLHHPDWRLDLHQLSMRWFYWPPDHVQIPHLGVAEMRFEQLERSDSPPVLPQTLGLPFDLNISTLEIERLLIISPDAGRKTIHEVRNIKARLGLGQDAHQLQLQQSWWNGIQFKGQGKIQTSAPFITRMNAQADRANLELGVLQLPWKKWWCDITGDLTQLTLKLRTHSDDAKAKAISELAVTTILRPFSAEWLQPVKLQVRNLAWASLVQNQRSPLASWQALLEADIFLSLVQGRPQINLDIRNKLPGKWAEKKIPWLSLQARLDNSNSNWQVNNIQMLDWSGQRMTGSAQWLIKAREQQMRLDLHLPGLDAKATWIRPDQSQEGAWQIQLQARHWNPASLNASLVKQGLSEFPVGTINGTLHLRHTTSGMPFELALQDSSLANLPLSAQAKGLIVVPTTSSSVWELQQLEFLLAAAGARLHGAGSWGTAASKLSLALSTSNLQRLATLWAIPAAGSAEIHAVVGGEWKAPFISASLAVTHLRIGGDQSSAMDLARLNGYIQIIDRQVAADFSADRIRIANTLFNEVGLQAQGSLGRHILNLRARGSADSRALQTRAEWVGGWMGSSHDGVWRGQWRHFDNQGSYRIRLQEPADLEIGAQGFKLNHAALDIADAHVRIDELLYDAGQWRSRGSMRQLSGQVLSRWLPGLATPRNTLTLGGRWDLVLGQQLEGEFELARESGDVWLSRVSNQALGVERLGVHIRLRDKMLQGRFELLAQGAGTLQAQIQTVLTGRDRRFALSGDAPLNASIQGRLTSLTWLGLLTDVPFSTEGKINLEAKAEGTWNNPQWQGFLNGDQLVLRSYQPSATLRDGKIRLSLESGLVQLREFSFSGRSGRLSAVGSLDPGARGEQGKIQITLDNLDALTDPWYRLVASGQLQVGVRDLQGKPAVRVAGKLRADQARLTLKDVTVPALSEDVVVINGHNEVSVAQRRFPVDAELEFDFGDDFEVAGYGTEARLKGSLALQARAGYPVRAVGTVRTSSGRYFAYGQELKIERGSLSFSGMLDNPGLNFYAIRENLPVEVGVEVSGTLINPRAKLISRPQMSNTEKISWLVLGHGLDSSSRNDLQLLSLAASALIDRGEGLPLSQQVARNIGLDDIGLRGGSGLEETIITLGKRLSSRLYLTLERSLGGTSTLAKLRYEVARRWYLQAVAGAESALDMFFTLSFD